MIEIIKQIDGWGSLTASQIYGVLSTTTTTVNASKFTIGDIVDALPEDQELLVLGTLKSAAASDPRIDSTWIAMSSAGVELASDGKQQFIDSLAVAGSWPDATRDTVKALGRPHSTTWADLGGSGNVPTQAQIQAELDRYARETAAKAIEDRSNAAREAAWEAYREGLSVSEITAAGEGAF